MKCSRGIFINFFHGIALASKSFCMIEVSLLIKKINLEIILKCYNFLPFTFDIGFRIYQKCFFLSEIYTVRTECISFSIIHISWDYWQRKDYRQRTRSNSLSIKLTHYRTNIFLVCKTHFKAEFYCRYWVFYCR